MHGRDLNMKIALVGLSGCGKTSIYATTFAAKTPESTQSMGPTIMYEIRRHPYLGLEVSIFDFGGQDQYRKSYIDKPDVFNETDVLVPIIDMHEPEQFDSAKQYFDKLIATLKRKALKPKIYLLYHKFDTRDYTKEMLNANYKKATTIFETLFKGFEVHTNTTSIYEQEKLNRIFRDILVGAYDTLKTHVEKAEKQLKEIDAKIIVADISGNVIVHNVTGVSAGLQLRSDFRDFIHSCNIIRENLFMAESAIFKGTPMEGDKEIELHIYKYVLAVLIMKPKDASPETEEKISELLRDLQLFAEVVISSHNE
ncbi:MAG TPA: ADP-ribosylation factor-like protein [Candidatus Lokiarchaeia archaeon]|nr:ADP-ribosylation factor-like protein [Candidatus Lokiarchaeia archaeon]